jgi:hypothetical protein
MRASLFIRSAAKKTPFYTELEQLRPALAASAQKVYDAWEQVDEDDVEGICDKVSEAMQRVLDGLKRKFRGVKTMTIHVWNDVDDHQFAVVSCGKEVYAVDIEFETYESYDAEDGRWLKKPDVHFTPADIVLEKLPAGAADEEWWGL